MTKQILSQAAVVVWVAVLAFTPVAMAHGAPEARAIDTRVLADGTTVGDYGAGESAEEQGVPGLPATPLYEGGHDLLALDLREAYGPDGAPGVYFRLIAQRGDPSSGELVDTIHVTAAGQELALELSTSDGASFNSSTFDWVGPKTPMGDGFPFAIDAFAAYTTLGVSPGAVLEDISVAGSVGGTSADVMPGTYDYMGQRVQDPQAEEMEPVSYELTGPAPLVTLDLSLPELDLAAGAVEAEGTLTVESGVPSMEQFVELQVDAPAGVTVVLDAVGVLLDNTTSTRTLAVQVTAPSGADGGTLRIVATSELGAFALAAQPVLGGADSGHDNDVSSGELGPGDSYAYRFSRTGDFEYHCHPHPWMTGTVEVVAVSNGTPPQIHTITAVEPDPADPDGWHFSPEQLTVAVGDTVVWVNQGQMIHDVRGGIGGHPHDHEHGEAERTAESPALGALLLSVGLVGAAVVLRRRR